MIVSEYLLFAQQAVWVLKSKVFGQESTLVKRIYQILGLHSVTVCQKLGVILVGYKIEVSKKNTIYKKGA